MMKYKVPVGTIARPGERGIFYLRRKLIIQETLPLLLLTLTAFLVMGYHPGFEDDEVYLTAVKADLNPALYPHDSAFFRVQMQASIFDTAMAHFVRWTHAPLAWAELLWQVAALFLILWACRKIAAQLFAEARAQWAAVAMVAAMFTLPVAGTALNIADQHLHPRNLATALILIAVAWILEDRTRLWRAVPLLLAAFLLHPLMAALGTSFCAFLVWALTSRPARPIRHAATQSLAVAAPLGWLFAPGDSSWSQALASKPYYSIYQWAWYEWLGALAPLLLFWLLWRVTGRSGKSESQLARLALAVFGYGVFQQIVAMILLGPSSLIRLTPLQPMRFLQLVYLFMALVAGGLLGRFVLKTHALRWTAYLLLINGGMFLVQWELIDCGAHLELPGRQSANPWVQAFDWIQENTPADAYFALDPQYLAAPGEGYRGFRAIAERSRLSDGVKDTSVVTQVPSLAPIWREQQLAQAGWARFQRADFERLKTQFGVDWVVVSLPQAPGLDCRWHNDALAVCRVP
jgi:hypothetical protein